MAYKYARVGPPFNFLGHFSESQWAAFKTWSDARINNFGDVQSFYQIRAQQMRKTAGLLEAFYATKNDQVLAPSFAKDAWQPGTDGYFGYINRNDQLPAATMSLVKERYQEQLQRDDEAVFFMNHLRNQIERLEDEAQFASTAIADVRQAMSEIDSMFSLPEYSAVLVKDQSDQYKGEPRFRVTQLDAPTQWEKERASHSTTIVLKETTPTS